MTTLQEIEAAIERLSPRDRSRLERWLHTRIFPSDDNQEQDENRVAEAAARYSAKSQGGLISYEEYLSLEEHGELRHEYVAGVRHAMAGASRNHNRISGNLFNAFSRHLGRGPCEVFVANFNVRVDRQDAGYYPDVMVTCDREKRDQYSTEARLIVEVLSPSTRQKDEREKWLSYRTVDSLEEYVLVEQDCPELVVYRRGTSWQRLEIGGLDAVVEFSSIGLRVPLAEVFEGVEVA